MQVLQCFQDVCVCVCLRGVTCAGVWVDCHDPHPTSSNSLLLSLLPSVRSYFPLTPLMCSDSPWGLALQVGGSLLLPAHSSDVLGSLRFLTVRRGVLQRGSAVPKRTLPHI